MLQWCFSRLISRLTNPRKTRVFSFIRQMWQFFKHSLFSLALPLSNPSQPKTVTSSKPHNFQANLCKINLKGMFLTFFSSFPLRLCKNYLRVFLNWGFFENGLGFLIFNQIFFKILIGLCPISLMCICVGPLWHLIMY